MAFFSSAVSSAMVLPGVSTGRNSGHSQNHGRRGLVRDNALAGALAIGNQTVRVDERDDAHKARGAVLICHAFQVNEKLGVVGGIVAVHAA